MFFFVLDVAGLLKTTRNYAIARALFRKHNGKSKRLWGWVCIDRHPVSGHWILVLVKRHLRSVVGSDASRFPLLLSTDGRGGGAKLGMANSTGRCYLLSMRLARGGVVAAVTSRSMTSMTAALCIFFHSFSLSLVCLDLRLVLCIVSYLVLSRFCSLCSLFHFFCLPPLSFFLPLSLARPPNTKLLLHNSNSNINDTTNIPKAS